MARTSRATIAKNKSRQELLRRQVSELRNHGIKYKFFADLCGVPKSTMYSFLQETTYIEESKMIKLEEAIKPYLGLLQ